MNPEKADASTQEAPSGCLSPFGLWVILWLLIVAAVISYQVRHWPQIVVDDWPDGGSSDTDHWHGGRFLGHSADRIRRIATYRADRVQQHSIHFFASIPMDQNEFKLEVDQWGRLGWFEEPRLLGEIPHCPDWFPFSPDHHAGTVREQLTSDIYHVFRRPGDHHLYLLK